MENNCKVKFIKHVQPRGPSLYQDKCTLRNLISDIFSNSEKLRNTLKIAVDNDVSVKVADLLTMDTSRQKIGIKQIIYSLNEEYGIEKSRAAEAVYTLCLGLGMSEDTLGGLLSDDGSPQLQKAGELIIFGKYEWCVLDVQNNRVLILCNNIPENREYHAGSGSVAWEDCTLRRYLNGDFYESFDQPEKVRIAETNLINCDNPWFGTNGGQNTVDSVFLPSVEEIVKYFGDSGQLKSKNPNDGYHIDDEYNTSRLANNADGTPDWWWLRTPGLDGLRTANVYGGGTFLGGKISMRGDLANNIHGGVRPALWLNM